MINSARKILLFFVTLCSVIFSCHNYDLSEDQVEKFVKYYPTSSFSYGEGTDLIQTPNGNYLVIGIASQNEETTSDQEIMIIKTNEFGRELDQSPMYYGTSGYNYGYKVVPAGDGGYVIAGSSKQVSNTFGYILKINLNGDTVFEHTIGTTPLQEFMGITASSDGGFILAGYSKETDGDKQVYLVKTDSRGFTVWERVIGFIDYNDVGEAVVELNGCIIIAGTTAPVNTGSGNSRLLILNTNSEGKGMTELRISADGDLTGTDMVVDNNGNIIILGNQENDDLVPSKKIYLTKIKLEGFNNELITVLDATSVEYTESLYGKSIVINTDNSLAICGWQEIQDDRNILFARINPDLSLNDIQLFGSAGYQSGAGISGTTDGGYIITGGAEVAGNINTVLIKLGLDGKLY